MKLNGEILKAMNNVLDVLSNYEGICWNYSYTPESGCSIYIYEENEEENTDGVY